MWFLIYIFSILGWFCPWQSWDPYLASVAQAYAQQCIFSHNSARSTQYTAAAGTNAVASYVGENLYVTSGGDTPGLVGSAIQAWYSEKSGHNLTTNSCSGVCGHYTQVSHGRYV